MKTGHQTCLNLDAFVLGTASVAGKKEKDGPLGGKFDLTDEKDKFGAATWEEAESEMQRLALNTLLAKAKVHEEAVDYLFAGDLLNQCVGSSYGLLPFDIPYFGLYGACSTSVESLFLASQFVSAGSAKIAAAVTSSHFCSAERQFRTPLEYGGQRPPTAQWTVTGAGAYLIGKKPQETKKRRLVHLVRGMAGIVVERGVKDASNMGAAMAPAAESTLVRFFRATGTKPGTYDLILTGDLGFEGGELLCDLLLSDGYDIRSRYDDCGRIVYDRKEQDVHCGGSGCGCAAIVTAAKIIPEMELGLWKRVLFLATGAMMSPDSIKQGKAIPAVAHLIELEGV